MNLNIYNKSDIKGKLKNPENLTKTYAPGYEVRILFLATLLSGFFWRLLALAELDNKWKGVIGGGEKILLHVNFEILSDKNSSAKFSYYL